MKSPDFKTEEEELKFWEKHSISNYWEDLKEAADTFKRPKLTPVTIKFDPLTLKKKLRCSQKKEPEEIGFHPGKRKKCFASNSVGIF